MHAIESKVDIHSEDYKKNYAAMEALVEDLRREMKRARDERSRKALDRLIESGKLSAQKKLDLLLDKNTPFLEIAPLAGKDMYDGKVHAAGLRAGIGVVSGKEVVVSINDATIKGGSAYPISAKKTLRLQTIAMENRLPSVSLVDSAGAYLPLQSQIFPDIDGGGRVFYNQA
ncbi:MAG: carboxyl transferase domain-containing protein, partial [Desulfobacterales bacterium]